MIGWLLCRLGFHPWPEEVGNGCFYRCPRCRKLTPKEGRTADGSFRARGGVVLHNWATGVDIAYCPEHGLHGERERCFVCNEPVVRVRMWPAASSEERP